MKQQTYHLRSIQKKFIWIGLLGTLSSGCQETDEYAPPTSCNEEIVEDGLECNGIIRQALDTTRAHIDETISLEPACAPPSQGDHYPRWSVWGESNTPVPSGYWIHNLEHGGVALLYRCDEGCDDWVAALRNVMDEVPIDLSCTGDVRTRTLLTESPELPASPMIAAVAWGFSYSANCVVEEDILGFIEDHYGNAPESLCAQGAYAADMVNTEASDRTEPGDSGVRDTMALP